MWEHLFRKFGEWVVETFSDSSKTQTPCDMAVMTLIISEFPWKRHDCSMFTPPFNIAPLEQVVN